MEDNSKLSGKNITVSGLNGNSLSAGTDTFLLYITVIQNSAIYEYSSSTWNSCSNITTEFTLDSVDQLYIRANRSSAIFNYKITVSESSTSPSSDSVWIFILIGIVFFMIAVVISALVIA